MVVIVGAGPVGLSAAVDLATREVGSIVLDDNDVVSTGSRAICWSKRTLEIFDRLGIGDRCVAKGVTWQKGRVFRGDSELYEFDLLPESGHKMPAFINLQQYYVEEYLIDRAADFPDLIDLRWKNKVVGLGQEVDGGVTLSVDTPDGGYVLQADWVLAADGAGSPVRRMLGLPFEGHTFEERFLIADVKMKAGFPNERLFWFQPSFHPGQSALLHRQPDDVFRLDFQLGPDADPDLERRPERVIPRVKAIVGDTPFDLEWCSVYAFRCARLERFIHGRVIFVGDSAHVVSPFGARGGNGGIQDVDNLCWKLALAVRGDAQVSLVGSYEDERGHGADENIRNSSRTTNFMTPKTGTERLFRDAVLDLAPYAPFARALTNAGRLSRPCSLAGMPLQSEGGSGILRPGTACPDAPLLDRDGNETWLLGLLGREFAAITFVTELDEFEDARRACLDLGIDLVAVAPHPLASGAARVFVDRDGYATSRYGGSDTYLIRPDQHVAAVLPGFDPSALAQALERARGTPEAARTLAA